ncbi:MAG: hypothetical protein ACP5N7_01045 [Candidatus Pacearchaeota archaeon]
MSEEIKTEVQALKIKILSLEGLIKVKDIHISSLREQNKKLEERIVKILELINANKPKI